VDWLADDTVLLTPNPLMVCPAWGLIGADVRPDWSLHTGGSDMGRAHS
jgi:hypothetical protein